jgi:hypothetical protein
VGERTVGMALERHSSFLGYLRAFGFAFIGYIRKLARAFILQDGLHNSIILLY